jgi:Uma2 family endonuclease
MCTALIFEDELCIPAISSLDDFRHWMRSDEFPERGRIDYVAGRMEIDMSPENLFFHGKLKGRICATLVELVEGLEIGHVFVDSTRITCVGADVSAEPDVVVLTDEAIDTGRVKLIPAASGGEDSYIEIEGPPDLIVEIVSDSSVNKDTKRLPVAYFAGGVPEFWLVDARRERLSFQIHDRGETTFHAIAADADGFQRSPLLNKRFRLERRKNSRGRPAYILHVAD